MDKEEAEFQKWYSENNLLFKSVSLSRMKAVWHAAYNCGDGNGYERGFNLGWDRGMEAGYSDGYNAGRDSVG